ncbi:Heme oxygenase 1, chloroplastic [Seminavis robusta]|uniref:Heme oxygenase 1, chloroplastic n=1 Tax=Seminavis robusta TaxID=568900 RepID=A0A9N8DE98_9STRA|nr:Heme oxygenase 1, chloroplastic [Seminavis robusta]|eukprot:Sro78_g042400.1 Heme oxygenase 1, chloroplastic (288) ;mRNA; r:51296-52253
MRLGQTQLLAALCLSILVENQSVVSAFSTSKKLSELQQHRIGVHRQNVAFVHSVRPSLPSLVILSAAPATATAGGFIETELRGAAMKLHTKQQAPKEGQVEVKKPAKPYTPTRDDYLAFLVDSKHVYEALEDIVNENEALEMFRNTGLERTEALETDIEFMVKEYGLSRPEVGEFGKTYATQLREIAADGSIPELMCHYYNFYFAHTAGGRMIGKQMSALLLEKKTLEFYKWDGDLNEIKGRVKESIEAMAATWSQEEKDACVAGTADAFRGGGMINAYLSGGASPH